MATLGIEKYPIDSEALGLKELLDTILAKVVAVYASYDVPLPSRQYWTFGQPAFDCEQIVVSFIQAYLGTPGNQASEPVPCSGPRSAVVQISVVRATATPSGSTGIPAADKIQAAAHWQAVDAWVLLDAIRQFNDWGDGLPGIGVIATVDGGTASGGFHDVSLQLTVGMPS
jgi:hypothetical protein